MSNLDFNSLFGDAEIDFECPNCENNIVISINQIGTSVICSNCNVQIDLEKDSNFDNSISETDSALQELDETFKNFGK